MKKFSFLALAAAGMLFAACSSDKDVAEATTSLNGDGDGFVGVTISIPSAEASTTRANDDLTNGKTDEFKVENAFLYLFKGSTESDATFLKRYSVSQAFEKDTELNSDTPTAQDGVTWEGGTGVTSTATAVCKVDNVELASGQHLFAFVAVNVHDVLESAPSVGTPFSTFADEKLADHGGSLQGDISNGLLMTNSPIYSKAGGSAAPEEGVLTTLVQLNDDAIKLTQEAALAAPAGCIYVERAAAKVTVTDNIQGTKQITMGTSHTLDYAIQGWQVFNVEPKFYNTRHVETSWNPYYSEIYGTNHNNAYRFVTMYNFAPTKPSVHTKGFRTYFAKDIQYSGDFNLTKPVADLTSWLGADDRAFVTENTFDVEHQTRQNTTQVAIKVKFGDGSDIYTLSDDADYYAGMTNAINAIIARLQDNYEFKIALQKLADAEAEKLAAGGTTAYRVTAGADVTITSENSATGTNSVNYTVSYKFTKIESKAAGETDWTDVTTGTSVIDLTETEETTAGWTDDLIGTVKASIIVKLYKGGVSYYNVRIQHFGTQETPWSSNGAYVNRGANPYEIDDIYGAITSDYSVDRRNGNFLGRYGVVRDNWYNLSIDEIKKLGSAEPLTVTGDFTPDDEVEDEYYISAHVHILPWVLRTQSVKF